MKDFDIMIIGPVSLDHNIDHEGHEVKEIGGAVVASGYAASRSGKRTAVFTKFNGNDVDINDVFSGTDIKLFWKTSANTCSIRNRYFTEDKEKRNCTAVSICDTFTFDELPEQTAEIYQFAGLMQGDFSDDMFLKVSGKGRIAVDAQGILRRVMKDGTMELCDWPDKKKYFPYIDFLKADAAEAEVMTGTNDREKAAKILYGHGAKEIIITHHSEILVYDGREIHTCPIKARNISGRTGRGDTVFAGYLTERLHCGVDEALLYSAALVSLKMETPGPFKGDRNDVLNYISRFYKDEGATYVNSQP